MAVDSRESTAVGSKGSAPRGCSKDGCELILQSLHGIASGTAGWLAEVLQRLANRSGLHYSLGCLAQEGCETGFELEFLFEAGVGDMHAWIHLHSEGRCRRFPICRAAHGVRTGPSRRAKRATRRVL